MRTLLDSLRDSMRPSAWRWILLGMLLAATYLRLGLELAR